MVEIDRAAILRLADLERRMEASRIPYPCRSSHTFEKYQLRPGTEKAYAVTRAFLGIAPDGEWDNDILEAQHPFLVLAGPPGSGKSHLAIAALLYHIHEGQGNGIYWQVADFLESLRRAMRQEDGSYDSLVTAATQTGLLVMDDLGAQKDSDWTIERLDVLVDSRYVNELQTIFTTNLEPDAVSPRIRSRLKEGETVEIRGADFRPLLAARRRKAREADI